MTTSTGQPQPSTAASTGAREVRARPTHRHPSRRRALIGPSINSAFEALWANRMRSLLTALGIIVGVAAVIIATAITQGASDQINARVAGLGTNTLIITSGAIQTGGARGAAGTQQSLTQADADGLTGIPHVVNVSPVQAVNAQIIYGDQNWNTRVQGVYPNYQAIGTWQMSEGAWFSASDESGGVPVAVIGQTIVDNLFTPTGTDPVGQTILIRNQAFRVVGVLQAKGTQGFANQDDVVFVPFSAAQTRLSNVAFVSQIQAQVDNASNVSSTQAAVTARLEQLHNLPAGGPDDFQVRSPTQFVQTAQAFTQTLTFLLVGVAAVSLIVGGIGIMNIMLVSVTERTREIGIRMAVGARRSDVRNQFLMEALTLSAAGGVIGIVLGLLAGFLLTRAAQLPYAINPLSLILAFGVSAAIGVGFGLYPAVRASRLDPIVALRTE